MFVGPRQGKIETGDGFVKVEDPETVWTVDRFVHLAGLPRHAELLSTGPGKRRIMISEVALLDSQLYRRAGEPPRPIRRSPLSVLRAIMPLRAPATA